VDEAAEPVAATEPVECETFAPGWLADRWRLSERRSLPERAVRPVLVVMLRIVVYDDFELAAAKDQQPVETFPA
jgi:hypothetical protein